MEQYELHQTRRAADADEPTAMMRPAGEAAAAAADTELLNRRILKKLDFILLPFLALLFLFNSLDKSNIGNAETDNFTADIGIEEKDLNDAVAVFYAVFVALQPLGAALGRRYGMVKWVPGCMTIWGICTMLHVWVRAKWQLVLLRMIIGTMEAGFYPVTVSYLSLFYTRYEFARRLAGFYGQAAVAGALGGVLSYGIFSHFPEHEHGPESSGWKSWQFLFLLEGCATICIAITGFFFLPHGPGSAWFLSAEERAWAEERIKKDRASDGEVSPKRREALPDSATAVPDEEAQRLLSSADMDDHDTKPISPHEIPGPNPFATSSKDASVARDTGLTPHDVLSAVTSPYIYLLLIVNILSSIPGTAFSVFLPLVISSFSPSPSMANLLTAPPFIAGAIVLFAFTYWSDRIHQRLMPILVGLSVLLFGLSATVLVPHSWVVIRYLALCVLLSGTFIASPLTVAWLADNTPSPGKRAILLGINGWGNLAGVIAAMIFQPQYKPGYQIPFIWTCLAVGISWAGYLGFRWLIITENERRATIVREWSEEMVDKERLWGVGPMEESRADAWMRRVLDRILAWKKLRRVREWVEAAREEGRAGDERVTFRYGL